MISGTGFLADAYDLFVIVSHRAAYCPGGCASAGSAEAMPVTTDRVGLAWEH